jgi:hypothetical protein
VSDLRRILQDDPSERETLLITSARLDAPPAAGKGRVLAALGFAAVTTATAGAGGATAVATTGTALVIKWLAIGVVGSAITLGTVEGLRPRAPASAPLPAAKAVVARPAATSLPGATVGTLPDAPSASAAHLALSAEIFEEPPPILAAKPAVHPAASHELVAAPSPPPSPPQPTLTTELVALDDARHALASGDAATSMRLLDAYGARFAQPILAPEATVLRIEALVALGRGDEARGLAGEFLASQPDSPYAERVRSLLGRAAAPAP